MIKKKKKFSWPRQIYHTGRIADENKLLETYGLKNKREVWRTETQVKYFRDRAKSLITADPEEQKLFFNKLKSLGLKVETIADVLALKVEDLLKRRLATVVWKKGLAHTAKQARQMVVHKKVLVGDRVVNVPGYVVKVKEEPEIKVRKKVKKPKEEKSAEEDKEENGGKS